MLRLPLEVLHDELAQQHASCGDVALRRGDLSLDSWLTSVLNDPAAEEGVPCINGTSTDSIPDGSIIRFVGMIQDVRDPEYYDGVYEEVHPDGTVHLRTTMYQGCISEPCNDVQIRPRPDFVWQRTPVACAPIPSRAAWLDELLARNPAAKDTTAANIPPLDIEKQHNSKRAAEELLEVSCAEPMDEDNLCESIEGAAKRTRAHHSPGQTGRTGPTG